jgi:hypothetical protein
MHRLYVTCEVGAKLVGISFFQNLVLYPCIAAQLNICTRLTVACNLTTHTEGIVVFPLQNGYENAPQCCVISGVLNAFCTNGPPRQYGEICGTLPQKILLNA